MLRKPYLATCLITLGLAAFSCNPDCETSPSANVVLPPPPYQADTELAITANPASFLEDREFLISMTGASGLETTPLESRFEPRLGAAIVKLPASLANNANFWIDDPDCTGQLIPIGTPASLVDESFFVDNPLFITPTPPLIIIPFPPPNVPPAIINAWFSPTNRDYCIWFKPQEGPNGEELPNLVPAIADGPNALLEGSGPQNGSAELSANCSMDALDRLRRPYHANPVAGIVDKEKNFIQIQVDRTAKGLGVEEFVGQFVDPDMLPDATYSLGGSCDQPGGAKPNIMFLTSQQTGRQLILYRGLD